VPYSPMVMDDGDGKMQEEMGGPEFAPCCEMMRDQLDWKCDQHSDPAERPDALIGCFGKSKTLGLLIHDGGSSFVAIHYCPWCGTHQAVA
jgi:hypothetical protein